MRQLEKKLAVVFSIGIQPPSCKTIQVKMGLKYTFILMTTIHFGRLPYLELKQKSTLQSSLSGAAAPRGSNSEAVKSVKCTWKQLALIDRQWHALF